MHDNWWARPRSVGPLRNRPARYVPVFVSWRLRYSVYSKSGSVSCRGSSNDQLNFYMHDSLSVSTSSRRCRSWTIGTRPDVYAHALTTARVQRVLSCVQIRMHGMTGRCDCVSESKPRQAIMIVMLEVVGSR